MSPATVEAEPVAVAARELAHRRNGALEVFLLWHPADDAVTVRVEDRCTGVRVEMEVERSLALHAFRHPFSYAP